ncbi:unnamed protein product [Meloidogyne enterolobii]|uniref:Uncharacterized protein n=1 Tax=Meloidogyne enterolobii TaxID=390850 RepID=A0ACB0ZGF5_MELEN
MPNIHIDRQKEASRSSQEHLEVLITHREPPTAERTGLKRIIPSFLIKKSYSQKRTEKMEARRLQETDKEKAEKILAKQQRKERKRRQLALLAVLKERAGEERR